MPNQPFMQVDAFTEQPFSGNPSGPSSLDIRRRVVGAPCGFTSPATGSISVVRR